MQVISSLQNFLWPQMNVLSATLEAVTQFIRFMCKSNFPEMNEIANEFTRISTLLLKAEESKINPVLKLNEKVIQSFLKIPSLPTYLTLLSKCVSAAATISFNMENKEYPTFKMETKRRYIDISVYDLLFTVKMIYFWVNASKIL
ncbi:unnamed protein product [Orchesella dallaii]|uniref:Uncharacterized protein n=1 Tax=Orchesella dallaii TaxID=48710 RepID=A0ABP1QG65_9HEXA